MFDLPERDLNPPEETQIPDADAREQAMAVPTDIFYDCLADEMYESAGNGKSHLQQIFDRTLENDGAGVLAACWDVIDRMGATDYAREYYERAYLDGAIQHPQQKRAIRKNLDVSSGVDALAKALP